MNREKDLCVGLENRRKYSMNQLKDYLDVGAWGSDYLMARLFRDYWGKGFSIDDLQDDLLKITNQAYVTEVIRHIEWNVERWATEKGAPDKTDVVSLYSYDPVGNEFLKLEELAELADDIFMDEAELISISKAVEQGRSETKRYSIDSPEIQEIFDEIKKMDDE